MPTLRRKQKERPFAQIPNDALRDVRLSAKATGYLALLLSYPDDWTINIQALSRCKRDGKESVMSALKELEQCGYLLRRDYRTKGMFQTEYILFDSTTERDEWEKDNSTDAGLPMRVCRSGSTDAGLPDHTNKVKDNTEIKNTGLENIECFATNQSPQDLDVIQTVAYANESRQHQDESEVQEVKYISLGDDPNISRTPHSAAPPTIPQLEENSEAIAGELVVITPVIPISNAYDLTHLGLEGMPEGVRKGLEEATKARDKKKYTYEIQNASKYLIGNLPKHYRKSKVILSPSPNDIDPKFKQYLFDQMKDAKELNEATNWIKAMELDPTRWEELSDSVRGFVAFLKTGKNMKQIKKDFKMQQAEEHSDGSILDKIRKGLL